VIDLVLVQPTSLKPIQIVHVVVDKVKEERSALFCKASLFGILKMLLKPIE